MKTLIVIPARYASTRLPGKPLAMIAGKPLLARVIDIAKAVVQQTKSPTAILVATDDARIGDLAQSCGVTWTMTSPECRTGTDRVYQASQQSPYGADFILNLQGDTPFTPPDFLTALIESYIDAPCDVVTPATQLSWLELERLRESKKTTPFSGTTVAFDSRSGRAHWFSKNIIPAIRLEGKLKEVSHLSPVWRHIGLYGYSRAMLKTFIDLPEGRFEEMEGLEQLRILENGYTIRCVPVSYGSRPSMTGIDAPEDIPRAEALIAQFGDITSKTQG